MRDTFASLPRSSPGFTLVEICVAMFLLTIAAAGVAVMSGLATRAAHTARAQTSTSLLARQKLDEIRSLLWTRDDAGFAVTDTTTNLSVQPYGGGGGGLSPSPHNALEVNVAGFVDFLAPDGTWVAAGTQPPASALYVRRWRITTLPERPVDALVIEVLVTTVTRRGVPRSPRVREGDEALLTSVMARREP